LLLPGRESEKKNFIRNNLSRILFHRSHTFQIGVDFSAKLTITGLSSHFLYVSNISLPQPLSEIKITNIQQALKKKMFEKSIDNFFCSHLSIVERRFSPKYLIP
jgi:hypothetical protein